MKKKYYQIFTEKGNICLTKSGITLDKKYLQNILRQRLKDDFIWNYDEEKTKHVILNEEFIKEDSEKGIQYIGYTVPGYYESNSKNEIKLMFCFDEIESSDFNSYYYNGWHTYIKEL